MSSVRPPPQKPKGLGYAGLGVLALAVVVAVVGITSRRQSTADIAQWTVAQATPTVRIITPGHGAGQQELVLPGDIQAWFEAPIYARVSGYVKAWYQDIGAFVKAGQVLAEIDTPDLDQQFAQAKGDLAIADANAALANLTAKRWQALGGSNAVSQQTVDEKAGDAAAKKASVAAAQASVQRLEAMESFKRLTAPFDGVVTARRTDVGALINAGSGSGPELFSVADIHKMRVYVRVPQALSSGLQPGMKASLKLPQYPGRTFPAILTTTSNAVAAESRTVLVELDAENPDHTLWPGTYAEVHFEVPSNPNMMSLPTSALLFREHGLEVAVVNNGNKVVLKPIEVGRDMGTTIEVTSGISPSDRVIDSPPDSLSNGDTVRIAADEPLPIQTTQDRAGAKP